MTILKSVFVVLLSAVTLTAFSQNVKNAVAKKFGSLPYLISTPDNYSKEKSYPTIIFLHGADRSNTKHHPSKYAARAGIDFPFIVIAPSCTGGCSWSRVDLEGLLKEASSEFSIDPKRVYLTGYSMGGAGTWANLKKIHKYLAAAAPLAPAGGTTKDLCKVKDLPLRVYHGTADYGYNNSQKMIETLKECGSKNAKLMALEGKGHGIWPGIFSEAEFYQWLLKQKRE